MIIHYFKMAVRSLMKYRTQNIISMFGIAVGFVCFAFSMIWVRYELSYDDFHRGADRMYAVYQKTEHGFSGISYSTFYPVAGHIMNSFPEVEDAAAFQNWEVSAGSSSRSGNSSMMISVDSAFISMFDIKLISGSLSFLDNKKEVAVTEEFAECVYGTKDVLGKDLFIAGSPKKVSAIVSGWGKHSNFKYDFMVGIDKKFMDDYYSNGFYLCLRLKEGADASVFAEKLSDYDIKVKDGLFSISNFMIEKLTSSRYTIYHKNDSISLVYIKIFSVIGVAVILVALINFFSILATRMNIRRREIALRVSCGSGAKELILMFVTELLMVMFISCLIGMSIMELLGSGFVRLADIQNNFYLSSLWYFFSILVLSVIVAVVIIRYYSRRSISEMIGNGMSVRNTRFSFQGGSILIQTIISLTVLFCLTVLFKQLYYLKETDDVGFERKGRANLEFFQEDEDMIHYLEKLPYVYEVKKMYSLLPQRAAFSITLGEWDGKAEGDETFTLQVIRGGRDFLDFYGIRLLQGNYLTDKEDKGAVLINQAAVKKFGWAEPIGKKIYKYTVVGVIKDFHISPPTMPVKPYMITLDKMADTGFDYMIRYDEEYLSDLRESIKDYSDKKKTTVCQIKTVDEAYEEYLSSEELLMKLLSFVAVICVIISLFGVYSHVSLSCERRRKEIAIRKINGATTGVIMKMFIMDYMLMLVVSCVMAFLAGTIIMKKWLEQYVEQTSIDIWIYLGLFMLMAVFIILCVARSIWKAANENPAEVIKSE